MFENLKKQFSVASIEAKIIRNENNHLRIIGQKRVKLTKTSFAFANRSFVIDLNKIAYFSKNDIPVLFYELEQSIPLTIQTFENTNNAGKKPSSSVFDDIFRREKLKALLQSAYKAKQAPPFWIYLALGLVVGIIVGITIEPSLLKYLVQ